MDTMQIKTSWNVRFYWWFLSLLSSSELYFVFTIFFLLVQQLPHLTISALFMIILFIISGLEQTTATTNISVFDILLHLLLLILFVTHLFQLSTCTFLCTLLPLSRSVFSQKLTALFHLFIIMFHKFHIFSV